MVSSKPKSGSSLAEVNPVVASQAYGWDPTTLTAGSSKKMDWICQFGHQWKATVNSRNLGSGCPVCSGHKVSVGFNDLATTNPELASQADGWDPTTLSAGSNKKVGWKCKFNHRWKSRVAKRSKGQGCPICDNNEVLVGFNDLATTNPELALQADDWDPKTIVEGSGKKVKWKCGFGHSWIARPAERIAGQGCPVCSNKTVLVGFNDLATTNPELASQADGWDPTTLTIGSDKKVGWKCALGHRWESEVKNKGQNIKGCPYCVGQKVLVGFNDLATTNPELASQADGWDPTTLTAGSSKKVGWKCSLGHQWKSNVQNRTKGQGCPSCAKGGFDPNQPGFLYFIDHFDLSLFQIGITNFPKDRLGDHMRSGWQVIELRGPMDGHLTQKLETSCLHALEKRGAILGHKAGIEKFSGYSEAWTKSSLKIKNIKQILDWVYEDE